MSILSLRFQAKFEHFFAARLGDVGVADLGVYFIVADDGSGQAPGGAFDAEHFTGHMTTALYGDH
jgi:hypothetical protein